MNLTDKELDLLIGLLTEAISCGETDASVIADECELRAKLRAERRRIK